MIEDCEQPDQCHPALEGMRDWAIGRLSHDHILFYMEPSRPMYAMERMGAPLALDIPFPRRLERRKWAGPAPWTGHAFHYEWEGWVDEELRERTITGSAEPKWPEFEDDFWRRAAEEVWDAKTCA